MRIIPVEAAELPQLADFAHLTDVELRSRTEPERGLYLAESPKVIARALRAGHRPRAVLLQEKWLPGIEPLLRDHPGTPVYLGDERALEGITGFRMHRGAIAAMHRPQLPETAALLASVPAGNATVLVLEDLVDHANVGAAFRAAAALGAAAVLVTGRCADPLYRRSIRVSMGAVLQLPWTRAGAWPQTAGALRRAGFRIAALALDERATPLRDFAAEGPGRVALCLGSEGDGLSPEALAHADETVVIPMRRGVDSLNVAAASAVALYALTPR